MTLASKISSMNESIILKYAYPLDADRRSLAQKRGWWYPLVGEVRKQVEVAKNRWKEINQDNQVISRIEELTGLNLPYPVEAYLIGGVETISSMSHPLIITLWGHDEKVKTKEEFAEVVIHELLHRYVGGEDFPQLAKFWEFIRVEYADEQVKTQNHIILYVFWKKIFEEFFGKENLDKYSVDLQKWPDYKRAWDIAIEKENELFEKFKKLTSEWP